MLQPVIGQHHAEAIGRALAPGGEQDALAVGFQPGGMVGDGLEQVDAVLGPLGGEGPTQTAAGVLGGGVEWRQTADISPGQCRVPVLLRHIEAVRRQGAVGGASLGPRRLLACLISVAGQVPAVCTGGVGLVVEEDRGAIRKVVEQGLEPVVEQRDPVLHALPPGAVADGRIERIIARRAEQVQIAGAEPADGAGVQQGLGHGRQGDLGALAGRALGRRIEGADRFQFGAEHVEPYRLLEARRKDIDDPAAHGVFAALVDGRGAHVAVGGEIDLQRLDIELPPDDGLEPGGAGDLARRRALEGRGHGRDDQQRPGLVGGAPGQSGQRGHAFGRDARGRAQPVVGQAVPGRKLDDLDVPGEEVERLHEGAGAREVPGHEDADAAGGLQPVSDDESVQPFRRAAQFLIGPPIHPGAVHQPAPSATAAATWARMKARSLAISGVSCSAGVGRVSMIQA